MASWGTVNQLSLGKGRNSGTLLTSAFSLGQQFPRVSPLNPGQQFDCFPRSHGIIVCNLTECNQMKFSSKQIKIKHFT